jgi:hypothetical protein
MGRAGEAFSLFWILLQAHQRLLQRFVFTLQLRNM